MKSKVINFYTGAALFALSAFLVTGCGGEQKNIEDLPQDEVNVGENTSLLKIDNKIFHFQNPVQTALIMKSLATPFSVEVLNSTSNAENYATSFSQAVNIGVYGADLGFITANNKNQEAIKHLAAIKKLAEDLDVATSFDFGAMEKFGSSVGDQQQMLSITTTAYKGCETFLKEENRHDLFGLMMAGAMIEGLYFAITYANEENNQEVVDRLADQIKSIDNIILVLNPHYNLDTAPELSHLLDDMVELQKAFKALKTSYAFNKSEIDVEGKIATIKCTSTYSLAPAALVNIGKLVSEIRNTITGNSSAE